MTSGYNDVRKSSSAIIRNKKGDNIRGVRVVQGPLGDTLEEEAPACAAGSFCAVVSATTLVESTVGIQPR